MKIESARYEGGELKLATTDPEARRFVYQFKAGEYELVKAKKKRSLDANAYAWVLMDKLAEVMRIPKEEIYRNTVRNIGGNAEHYSGLNESIDKLASVWERKGLGWQAEKYPSDTEGYTNVILYYGSSSYDVTQMSRLIDNLVEDCRALDIETLPPDRLNSMLEAWDAK